MTYEGWEGERISASPECGGQTPATPEPGTDLLLALYPPFPILKGMFLPAVPSGQHCLKERVTLGPLATLGKT